MWVKLELRAITNSDLNRDSAVIMSARCAPVLFDVMLKESLPQTFVGWRKGVLLALIIIVVVERCSSARPMGSAAQQLFDMPRTYAAIFTAGELGYTFNLLFLVIARRFVHWVGR